MAACPPTTSLAPRAPSAVSSRPRRRRGVWPGLALVISCSPLFAAGDTGARAPALAPAAVDHRPYTAVLRAHVRQGRVDYPALRSDRQALDAYLAVLGTVPKAAFDDWDREHQLAFLLNLYNAATLQLIIDHPGVRGIREIGGAEGPWRLARVSLFGKLRTLDFLEHELIRPVYAEPRVHFALVCAAQSCPHLRPEAYEGPRLAAQLEDDTRAFVRRTTTYDKEGRFLTVSALFEWFAADFAGQGGVVPFLVRYLEPAFGAALVPEGVTLRSASYDWGLNGASP
ncbi:MAG: DUF547 domain-containing protein [Myxococcota bacterium]